jgi:hypothetical protein
VTQFGIPAEARAMLEKAVAALKADKPTALHGQVGGHEGDHCAAQRKRT